MFPMSSLQIFHWGFHLLFEMPFHIILFIVSDNVSTIFRDLSVHWYRSIYVILDIPVVHIISRDPLLLQLLGCSLAAIDIACESLLCRSFSIDCRFIFPLLPSPHVFCNYVGVPLPSIHDSSFFFSFICFLCFELLKFVPPSLFFRFFPGSIVETVLCSSSFMCASPFPSDYLFGVLYSLGIFSLRSLEGPSSNPILHI